MNLLEVSAVIGHMKILITPDTSLVHIARSFKVPVVGLYTRYEKNLRMWRPYRQKSGTVVSNNDYNIHDIEIDRVFEAVVSLLPPGDC
jgi:ADP-heptose:LPS heptosyltransferase